MAGDLVGVRIRRHMFLSTGCLEVSLIFTAILLKDVLTAYAQQPAYFVSIDCGGTQANYIENSLQWVSDSGTYMNIGNSIEQPSIEEGTVDSMGENQALLSYRHFPDPRNKYCYELPIPNTTFAYLLRVGFYMNSSMLNSERPFQFVVSVDATDWFTLTSGNESVISYVLRIQEGIFHPPLPIMNICLQPVVGKPFISSLELRQLNDTKMYSYPGGGSQYLSLAYRLNAGAQSPTPDVRYPDDPYDRIWATPADWANVFPSVLIPTPPDNTLRADVYYVPPKVMQDAWLFSNDLGFGVFFYVYTAGPQFYINPGDYVLVVVYAENLNASVSQSYNMTIGLDFNPVDPPLTISNQATALVHPYYILGANTIIFSASLDADPHPDDSPTMNAIEIYGQYSFNFSTTNQADAAVITALKAGFSLTDWQGDPCTPAPHNWLSCNLSNPIFGNLQQPCGFTNSTVKQCSPSQVALRSKYYVISLNIFNHSKSGFSGVIGNTSAFPENKLSSLQKMSITNSEVDNKTFDFLVNYTSQGLNFLDFSYNNLTGVVSSFENAPFVQTLQYLNLSHNAMTSFPTTWRNTTEALVILDLSHNRLHGTLSSLDKWVEINGGSLQEIYISNNNLSGTFSSKLYFSSLPNLNIGNFDENSIQGILNLSSWQDALSKAHNNLNSSNVTHQLFSFVNNNISSIVPSADQLDSTIRNIIKDTNFSFYKKGVLLGGNPYCKSPKTYMHQYLCRSSVDDDIKEQHNKHRIEILIISIVSGFVGIVFFGVTSVTLWKLWKQVFTLREIQKALADRKVQPPFYHYSDLKSATRDFHKDNKLGHGGFGIVYKGVLADGTQLAVKKLFNSQRVQVLDEFLNEVVLITGIKHRNLVQLTGCCIKDKQRILVYEYAENGNLAEAIWGSKAHGGLSWQQRFKICVGVARGLCYLHEELQSSIIHRDIKPENILLDKNFNPKIADFGLARHASNEASQAHYTQIAGTLGYFAPEYVMQGQLSEKIDVYSYGILILEVVSGRKCIDLSRTPEERFLKDWVGMMCKKDLLYDILQPELREACNEADVIRAIKIGLLCVQLQPELRPTMSQVVTMFLGNMDIEVFSDDFDNIRSNLSELLSTIDHGVEYPTMQIIQEDSAIFPLLDFDLDYQSSFSTTGSASSSRPLTEMSTFSAR